MQASKGYVATRLPSPLAGEALALLSALRQGRVQGQLTEVTYSLASLHVRGTFVTRALNRSSGRQGVLRQPASLCWSRGSGARARTKLSAGDLVALTPLLLQQSRLVELFIPGRVYRDSGPSALFSPFPQSGRSSLEFILSHRQAHPLAGDTALRTARHWEILPGQSSGDGGQQLHLLLCVLLRLDV